MKFFRGFLATVVALSMMGCNKENTPNNTIEETAGDAYMAVGFRVPEGPSVRAAAASAEEQGTESEMTVNSVLVVLYSQETSLVEYAWELDAKRTGAEDQVFTGADVFQGYGQDVPSVGTGVPTNSSFISMARKVKKADYHVAIFLNPNAKIKEITAVGKNKSELDTPISDGVINAQVGQPILMSNEQGLVPVPSTALQTTADEAHKKPIKVNVDRTVAKVTLIGKASYTNTLGDEVSDVQWILDVTNKKTYWMRKLAPLHTGTQEALNDGSSRQSRYAIDPNYNGEYNTLATTALGEEFNYVDLAANPTFMPISVSGSEAKFAYALENTMEADKQFLVATTQIIIKATYTPKGLTKGTTWVNYRGKKMHLTDFNQKIQEAQAVGASDHTLGMPDGFVAEMKGKGDFADESRKDTNLSIYKNGLCYYRVPIRHFSDDLVSTIMGYGRYGIVRNNVYNCTLSEIKIPGDPKITPPTPNTPDDKKKDYVSFDVQVNPWVIRTQDVEL